MSHVSMRILEDRARDVDPDLRYMALEDFQKSLESQQFSNYSFFEPLLFQLLEDPASEVQNQAIKTFAPLVRHSSDSDAKKTILKLYEKVEKTANASSFSSSVPTLALRGVFGGSQGHLNSSLSKSVFSMLLPRIFAAGSAMTIDKIEILIDLIRSGGAVLVLRDLSTVVRALITFAFREKGVVSKRSIIAIDACLKHVAHASGADFSLEVKFYDDAVAETALQASKNGSSMHSSDVFYTLLQVVISHGGVRKSVSEHSTGVVFVSIKHGLKLDQLEEQVDSEDLDIDELIHTNTVRENALITLAGLVPCFGDDSFYSVYASKTFEIVEKFLKYDPLSFDDSDHESGSEDGSEIDFSDDEDIEQFESMGENDALAAKLRLAASVVAKKMLQNRPGVVSLFLGEKIPELLVENIADKSEVVSNEAVATVVVLVRLAGASQRSRSRANSDVSMATENAEKSPHAVVSRDLLGPIDSKLFADLLTAKNVARFGGTKVLVEALIGGFSGELADSFLVRFAEAIRILGLSLKTFPDIVHTYKVILETYPHNALPDEVVHYIASDISSALHAAATYHSVVSDILNVSGILYKTVAHIPKYAQMFNRDYFDALAAGLGKKEYASDIKQRLLDSLADLMIHVDLVPENVTRSVAVFQSSLNSEVATSFAIEIMAKVCASKPDIFGPELCRCCLERLSVLLKSSDSTLHIGALTLLNTIFEKTSFSGSADELEVLRVSLVDLMKSSVDTSLIGRGLSLLGHITCRIPADEALLHALFSQIINAKLADVDEFDTASLRFLGTQISENNNVGNDRMFEIGKRTLVARNFISAKVMAYICARGHMDEAVAQIEQDLTSRMQVAAEEGNIDSIVFDIHFLGCVSLQQRLKSFDFQRFFEILKGNTSDQVCLAAARAMGLCTVQSVAAYLPVLLDCYSHASAASDPNRSFFLVALKQLLKEHSWEDDVDALRSIWDRLLQIISEKQGSLTHKEVSELKAAGDILSSITSLDHEVDYQRKLSEIIDHAQNTKEGFLIYTVVVIMKNLAGSANGRLETHNVGKIMRYLAVSNLELKSAIVSTLLTGIYNDSVVFASILDSVILPAVFDELEAKEEFRKVIPMGPYKYVVDEGLEVRRLSYELISAIINLNGDKVQQVSYQINEARIFAVILDKCVKDKQGEIINVAVCILTLLMHKSENVVFEEGKEAELIAALRKLSARKLSTKATAQDAETHEDILRSVLRLSKVTNDVFLAHNAANTEWNEFYTVLKGDHHLLFSALNA